MPKSSAKSCISVKTKNRQLMLSERKMPWEVFISKLVSVSA